MQLKEYFETVNGFGVLATAGSDGKPNAAVYARPHVMADGQVAFIMRDRLSHKNLASNPQATYLFREEGAGYKGRRIYLVREREEQDTELLESLSRRTYAGKSDEAKYLVFFRVVAERPLIGDAG